MRWQAWLIFILALGVGLVGMGGAAWWLTRHTFAGLVAEPPSPAADFTLTNSANQPTALSDLRGQWILLVYGYTYCPDVCPATLSTLRKVKAELGPQADRVRVVFVSVDPERDTPELLGQYVQQFGADFIGLTGSLEAVAQAANAYQVKYEKKVVASAAEYLVGHSAYVYLIDPQFRLRVTFPFGVKSAEITNDVQYLMKELP